LRAGFTRRAATSLTAVTVAAATLAAVSVMGPGTVGAGAAVGAGAGAAAGTVGVATPTASTHFRPGAAGVGDPYFPLEGNGGYRVSHYHLDLAYDPPTHHLAGVDGITAHATQNLSRFDLDLSGMTVRSVQVDGTAATFDRRGQELRITPARGIRDGRRFTVLISYAGRPRTIKNSPIVFGADYGWEYTKDGAFVGDEPDAARTWFPSNDHPTDKATFTFHVSVPKGTQAVANGDLIARHSGPARTAFVWRETSPMATYLASVDIGKWQFTHGRTPDGIPETMAVDPHLAAEVVADKVFARTGRITDFWSKVFGPYPFTSTGAIVDNVPHVGFSLEVQTRPLYGFSPDPSTMSHELSHQWFGDSVSVRSWKNIWLNEGFATYAAWLWGAHTGYPSAYAEARSTYRAIKASDPFWNQSVADPKRDTMFSEAVYYRGAMTLAALQHRIGNRDFFRLLQTWAAQHRYGNADTAQFVQLAGQVSGRDLGSFFHQWLWTRHKPAGFNSD
jgi:aminopeptidase N